jgi:hypothetical protein
VRLIAALAVTLILGGCHSGPVGAAGMSLTGTVLGIINQDWLAEQGAAVGIKINPAPVATPASGMTKASAQ